MNALDALVFRSGWVGLSSSRIELMRCQDESHRAIIRGPEHLNSHWLKFLKVFGARRARNGGVVHGIFSNFHSLKMKIGENQTLRVCIRTEYVPFLPSPHEAPCQGSLTIGKAHTYSVHTSLWSGRSRRIEEENENGKERGNPWGRNCPWQVCCETDKERKSKVRLTKRGKKRGRGRNE